VTATNSEAELSEDLKALFVHQKWLLRLAERLVRDHPAALDLVQETFLAAIKNPPPDATRPRAWLSAVAHRIHHKQQARLSPIYVGDLDDLEYGTGSLPVEAAIRWESISELHEAVKSLKPLSRETVLLSHQEDLGQAEVARHLKISTRAVRYRLKAAHREIRKTLGGRRWNQNGAWILPLIPILDPMTLRREAEAAAVGTGLGVLATIGGVAAICAAMVGAMFMLGGTEAVPIPALGVDDVRVASGEQRLSDPGSLPERQDVKLEDSEDLNATDLASLEPSSEIQPAQPDSRTDELFWISFALRSDGDLREGLRAALITEGSALKFPAPPEYQMALGVDGTARIGVREEGNYRLIISSEGDLSPGEFVYYTVIQMAYRGNDLEISLDLPATRRVTVRSSEEKIWLYTTTVEGWSIEGVCRVVDGEAVFANVPMGEIQVRLSHYILDSNENQPPIKTIRVELDGDNIFEIE